MSIILIFKQDIVNQLIFLLNMIIILFFLNIECLFGVLLQKLILSRNVMPQLEHIISFGIDFTFHLNSSVLLLLSLPYQRRYFSYWGVMIKESFSKYYSV